MKWRLTLVSLLGILNFVLICGQITESEHKTRKKLEKALNVPKISQHLRNEYLNSEFRSKVLANILIEFEGGNFRAIKEYKKASDSEGIKSRATKGERISNLVERLEDQSALSQEKVVQFLKEKGSNFKILWITNEIYVKEADAELVGEIADRFENVARIRPVGQIKPPRPPKPPTFPSNFPQKQKDIPWNVQQIKARCKDIKCFGEGVVVGIIDDGVRWSHEELKANYRQDFGWYDPVNGTELPSWSDENDHGTAVAGVAVGKTKGVAPMAQWIACRCFRINFDEEVYLKACAEFMLCPFAWNNTENRNCSLAPDIINNSWNAGPTELLTFPADFYYGVVEAWNAAGIVSVFAGGNEGPYCSTVNPPASYDIVFGVGATDNNTNVPYWSSRGPVLNGALMGYRSSSEYSQFGFSEGFCQRHCVAGDFGAAGDRLICSLIKPDISAPGLSLNSSNVASDTAYKPMSGTSFSSPTVAGVMALMICANKQTPGNPKRLEIAQVFTILKSTADISKIDLEEGNDVQSPTNFAWSSNLLCNIGFGLKCNSFPNNIYGAGQVDACAAVKMVRSGKF